MAVADSKMDLAERWPDSVGAGLERRLDQLAAWPSVLAAVRRRRSGRVAVRQKPRDSRERHEADRVRPLTDAEHGPHVADVKIRLATARAAGLATELQHTTDPDREIWFKARRVLHDQIVDDLYGAASGVPCERKAILAGGLPGGGKTTVLREYAGIDLELYLDDQSGQH